LRLLKLLRIMERRLKTYSYVYACNAIFAQESRHSTEIALFVHGRPEKKEKGSESET
jgi:hypothetical protein